MKLRAVDFRLIFGLIIAHLLLSFSFEDRSIFWYIITGSLLLLITYAMLQREVDDQASFLTYILLGLISGMILYGFFWICHLGILFLHLSIQDHINKLYRWYAPKSLWHYLALVFVIIPGEEFFWRGFVLKRLLHYFEPKVSIMIGSALYASVTIYSHSFILVLAFFLSGLVWGTLYFWKKSIPFVIVSHLVFIIMLFLIYPLK